MSEVAPEELLRAASTACEAAIRAGAEFADAFVERGETTAVAPARRILASSAPSWALATLRRLGLSIWALMTT